MEDKKVLNEKELEAVNGGEDWRNYEYEVAFGSSIGGGGGAGARGGSGVVIAPEPIPDIGPTSPKTNL